MTEYINRKVVIEHILEFINTETCEDVDVLDCIRKIPASDVRKNVRGKWIDRKRMGIDGSSYWHRECDQCGYKRRDSNPDKDSNFCPVCGADMRKSGDAE